jgi:sugar (pentulose or hexulose) kinase
MAVVVGVDLGTSKLTALALDTRSGGVLASHSAATPAETTRPADKERGYAEWDARAIISGACACLRSVADRLAERRADLAGIGITGQQHGVVLVDRHLVPWTPFINWQDRRSEQTLPGTGQTYVRRALELAGPDAPRRTGCRLAAGYMGVTLYWMRATGALPDEGLACFLMDYFAAVLTGRRPATDPTCGASSGLLDVTTGTWDADLLAALGLPETLLPPVRPSGDRLGGLTPALAAETGLPAGLPVFVGVGDNQASFVGSVSNPAEAVLVNVGTGGQVATRVDRFRYDPQLETRPFPKGGFLLVSAGLAGGASYAVLERFFREAGATLFGVREPAPLYPLLNHLAGQVPAGSDGLRCEPFFSGTRAHPDLRASWTGVTAANFTPAHLTRALLEGLARTLRSGYERIAPHAGMPRTRLVGAGNGLRENPVLRQIVGQAFGMPLVLPRHREEAAYGAALLAAVGSSLFPDLTAAGRINQYEEDQ